MKNSLPTRGAGTRRLVLALIVALHLVALLCWKRARPVEDAGRGTATTITFVALPQPTSAPPPARRDARVRALKPRLPEPVMTMVPPPVSEPAPAISTEPLSAEPKVDDLFAKARGAVGAIDRDLRKESLNMAVRKPVFGAPKRETLIAGAFIQRGPPRIVETVRNDGTRVSRIGNMCAYKEHNGLVGARDVFKDGVKTRYEQCPR